MSVGLQHQREAGSWKGEARTGRAEAGERETWVSLCLPWEALGRWISQSAAWVWFPSAGLVCGAGGQGEDTLASAGEEAGTPACGALLFWPGWEG